MAQTTVQICAVLLFLPASLSHTSQNYHSHVLPGEYSFCTSADTERGQWEVVADAKLAESLAGSCGILSEEKYRFD
jgi:hypothetical protein